MVRYFSIYIESFKLLANILLFLAAFFVSVSVDFATQMWPFALFLTAHILWGFCAIVMKDPKLVFLMFGFLIFDVWAIVVRI